MNMNEEILSEYMKPSTKKPAFWVFAGTIVLMIITAVWFYFRFASVGIPDEDLKASVLLHDVETQWIENGKVNEKNFKGVLLVPEFSFKVKNLSNFLDKKTGKKPFDLKFIRVLGVFRFRDTGKFMGEGAMMILKDKELEPYDSAQKGPVSKRYRIISDRGYRATSAKAFKSNFGKARSVYVEIFLKGEQAKWIKYRDYPVSKKMDSVPTDIKIIREENIKREI